MTYIPDEELITKLRRHVADELSKRARTERLDGRSFDSDDQLLFARDLLDSALHRIADERAASAQQLLSREAEEAIAETVLQRIFKLGRLQPLLDDESISNIDANGYDCVFVEYADGRKEFGPPIASSDEELIELLREVGRRYGLSEREFNPSRPSLNLQLPDGSRLFAIAWVCERPAISIRRHRFMKLTLDDLVTLGAIDKGLAGFLDAAVKSRQQILVTGATGAGKTTMLRALASAIPPEERIITIETEKELGLDRFVDLHPNCVALECRTANVEGVGEIAASQLVREALRMNPDRVIVGEVRGDEIVDMLNAMSQGNDGSMCTIHADSSATVFNKLALYAMQSPQRLPIEVTNELAAAAVDLVVWIHKSHKGRFVSSVRQVTGADGRQVITNELFRPDSDGRAVPGTPIPFQLLQELVECGYDPNLFNKKDGWWK